MGEIVGTILMLLGVLLILVAGVGLVRLPDLYLRMSAATKGATLGLALILLGAVTFFGELGVASRTIATIVFVFLTAPVSAHMIGRAAYTNGVPLWEGTKLDELEGRYDEPARMLHGTNASKES
ncbi:monovalent cation/H(+) antiporter subunit G [Candidatus Leptofilum sp.]|uniref:monovalent cation/H(+) antiporter subunit G n=1 Tax=Candidatus Leptofilum sp. TaxID=3241576 RepID=UPI003B59AB8D